MIHGRGRDRMVVEFKLSLQSVPISANVVSSNLALETEVFSIQHNMIKFVSDLWQVGGFLRFPPPIKLTTTT